MNEEIGVQMTTSVYKRDRSLHGNVYLSERDGEVRMPRQKFITASTMHTSELQHSHP